MSVHPSPTPQHEAPEAISTEASYTQLIAALHPPQPSVLEIDIPPSPSPLQILSDPPSLALPKSLLVQLYLHARQKFFSKPLQPIHIGSSDHNTRLRATTILLLFDPNHITAANFRKRHIQQCSANHPDPHEPHVTNPATPQTLLSQALSNELWFLTSLLTSPLYRHAKSSTLWAQRLWIFRHWPDILINTDDIATDKPQIPKSIWKRELHIVMKAGERHPRNYYAWNYARQLFRIVVRAFVTRVDDYEDLVMDTSGAVHKWCLMHPRDISGWAFLAFWMENVQEQVRSRKREDLRSSEGMLEDEVGRVARGTRAWVEKYKWKGQSVEWFLAALQELGFEEH